MGAMKEFYMTMAERGLVPVEENAGVPGDCRLTATDYLTRFGQTVTVPCISIEDAINWANNAEARPACPDFIRLFLADFACCEECASCDAIGMGQHFVNTGAEILCVNCA